MHRLLLWIIVIVCLLVFVGVWLLVRWFNRGGAYFFFDAQDLRKYGDLGDRELPLSSEQGTFQPFLEHYLGVTKLVVAVAAASITFGGHQNPGRGIFAAKLFLAFSIFYGVVFCAAFIYRYDEYTQDVRSYTPFWYSTVEGLGFAALICFILGYGAWALTAW
jgi:hypothetical protein